MRACPFGQALQDGSRVKERSYNRLLEADQPLTEKHVAPGFEVVVIGADVGCTLRHVADTVGEADDQPDLAHGIREPGTVWQIVHRVDVINEECVNGPACEFIQQGLDRVVAGVVLSGWMRDVQRRAVATQGVVDEIADDLGVNVLTSADDERLATRAPESCRNIFQYMCVDADRTRVGCIEGHARFLCQG